MMIDEILKNLWCNYSYVIEKKIRVKLWFTNQKFSINFVLLLLSILYINFFIVCTLMSTNIRILSARWHIAPDSTLSLWISADPPEYNKLYAIPGGVLLGSYGYAASTNMFPDIHQATYLAASLCCVGALTGLSSQTTSRIGIHVIINVILMKKPMGGYIRGTR